MHYITVSYPKNNSVFVNNSNSINFPSSHEMTNKIIQNDFAYKYNIDRYTVFNLI